MFTLYEVAYKGSEDRLYLYEDKTEAIRKRRELREEGREPGVIARRVIVPEYWTCDGIVYDDLADFYEACSDSDAPVVHHLSARHALSGYARARAGRCGASGKQERASVSCSKRNPDDDTDIEIRLLT